MTCIAGSESAEFSSQGEGTPKRSSRGRQPLASSSAFATPIPNARSGGGFIEGGLAKR
jgi:hypothetical protein